MPILDAIVPHITPFVLVLSRIGGLFLFAPGLGSPVIPARVKALLVIALTLVVYPSVAATTSMVGPVDLIILAPMILGEALIGLTIGLLVAIPLMSVQMGGLIIGQQMGLGLGAVYNPALDSEGDILGQILFFLALTIFLSLGGLELMHTAVLGTFSHVPLGGLSIARAPIDLLTGVVASGYTLAVRVAAPVLAIIMLETLSTGVLMKTVPQLNVLTFGFPVKIIAAMVVIIGSLPFINQVVHDAILENFNRVFLWTQGLTGLV